MKSRSSSNNSFFKFFNTVFLSISGLIALVALLSGVVIYQLFSSMEDVIEHTVPSVNSVSTIGANTLLYSSLLPRIADTESQAEIVSVSTNVINALKKIEQEIDLLDINAVQRSSITNAFSNLYEIEEAYTLLARDIVLKSKKLDNLSERLLTALRQISTQVKLLSVQSEGELFNQDSPSELVSTIATTQFISDMSHDVEVMTILVLNSRNTERPSLIEKTQEEFNTIFRRITFTLASIGSDIPNEVNLAFDQIYTLAVSDNNFFEETKLNRTLKQALYEKRQEAEDNISQFSALLGPILESNTEKDRESLANTLKSSRTYFVYALATAILTLLLVLYLSRTVVPKRIISPLKHMANDIIDLSRGNISEISFSHDSVELEKIRQALIIFQQTSERLFNREKELVSRNEQLNQLNKNLQTFLRVSSHDLRTPLRGIGLLTTMVEENIDLGEWTDSKTNLDKIRLRIKRMENLLSSLSSYIKAESPDQKVSTINFKNAVVESFGLINEQDQFDLQVEAPDQDIAVNEVPFITVIRNLLDNAVKHHDTGQGHLLVQLTIKDGVYSVSVTDDGPGIPERFQSRIFVPFETLAPKDEVEGSGMGLSIIQKLVESHGGQISLQSPIKKDRGATFSFTWKND